jgi:hypothetical protein
MENTEVREACLEIRVNQVEQKSSDHETRIRFLEQAHWRHAAIVGIAASICSALGSFLAVYAKLGVSP